MVNEKKKEKIPVFSITQDEDEGGKARITTSGDFFDDAHLQVNNGNLAQIRLSGVKQQQELNGTHLVQIMDAKNAVTFSAIAVLPNILTGFVTATAVTTTNPIESITPLELSIRKRGYGHSYPPRGRARNRKR